MERRRTEDNALNLFLASQGGTAVARPEAADLEWLEYGEEVEDQLRSRVRPGEQKPQTTVLLLDTGEPDALLITGADLRRLPRGQGGQELLSRAAAGAAVWRREYLRLWWQTRLSDRLIALAEDLNRGESVADVTAAVEAHATRIVEGYCALLLVPGDSGTPLTLPSSSSYAGRLPNLDLQAARYSDVGAVEAREAASGIGSPYEDLAPLFSATDAAKVAFIPVRGHGVLLLVERRGERVFGAAEWRLLSVIAGQVEAALTRLRILGEARDLSLTDSLTGLANRRHLTAFLQQAWPATQRGQPLTVVVLDIDHFKKLNDRRGHLAGDRVLCAVAGCLRHVARGSDLVVRYGGDEFLLVLPGESSAGAERLLQRFSSRLPEGIHVSSGIAEYHSELSSFERMVETADRALYASRSARSGLPQR